MTSSVYKIAEHRYLDEVFRLPRKMLDKLCQYIVTDTRATGIAKMFLPLRYIQVSVQLHQSDNRAALRCDF